MSNVSVEYLVLRDNVEYSRLTAFKSYTGFAPLGAMTA